MYEHPLDACATIKRPKDEKNLIGKLSVYRLSIFNGAFPSFRFCNTPDAVGLDKGISM